MLPSFRSKTSLAAHCGLLVFLLGLPVLLYLVGLPSREQAYASLFDGAGAVDMHVQEMFHDPQDADILFLGTSVLRAGISISGVRDALTAHLGRPSHVVLLAMNWQGLDLQYFMLRDYLAAHNASFVVWNLPFPGTRTLKPHVEAFRWVRYGEDSAALRGLPAQYEMKLYGDMVLGAPRTALMEIHPTRRTARRVEIENQSPREGYYGAQFVAENTTPPSIDTSLLIHAPEELPIQVTGPKLDAYELHFAKLIVELLRAHHSRVVLMHLPNDAEFGAQTMNERGDWKRTLGVDAPMLGVPSATLFAGDSRERFEHYFYDQHLNANGQALFTTLITPAILKVYDESKRSSSN